MAVRETTLETEAPELSVEQLRDRYWRDLYPLLSELSDWDLSVLGILTFRSGYEAPGVPVRKSYNGLGKMIGSRWAGGSRPAKRQVLWQSARHLSELELLERSDNNTLYQLIFPRPAATAPAWPAFSAFQGRLWSREFQGPMQTRAAISRLAFALDAEGGWAGNLEDLAGVFGGLTPKTAATRLSEIIALEKALKVEQRWEAGGLVIKISCEFKAPKETDDLEARYQQLRDQAWYPELIEEAIAKAGRLLKAGKITPSRVVTGFYEPVVALQQKYDNPGLIKFALEQTLRSDVFSGQKGKRTTGWHRYAAKVAENNRYKYRRAADPEVEIITSSSAAKQGSKVSAPQPSKPSLRDLELEMRQLLNEASRLNSFGKTEEAHSLLIETIGPKAKGLAPLFGGNLVACKHAIALAFKQGDSDLMSVHIQDPLYTFDHLPDYRPPEGFDAREYHKAFLKRSR